MARATIREAEKYTSGENQKIWKFFSSDLRPAAEYQKQIVANFHTAAHINTKTAQISILERKKATQWAAI
ncbi:hypothetical protein NIM87_11725 [Devosia sp. XJ19-1]|uniref:Uncharacterized protein n=1 Tax=Devosia ureilytica TaxID=2952754 RepID=A0A9Q4FT66_9HYPH|nr:hypothetical protein [Devosia ureilytica]MCP8884175.1 hypothetical protein [Devosia ureilytica]MCP8887783.1 hypothetical protein [Devosia ureilytica]